MTEPLVLVTFNEKGEQIVETIMDPHMAYLRGRRDVLEAQSKQTSPGLRDGESDAH